MTSYYYNIFNNNTGNTGNITVPGVQPITTAIDIYCNGVLQTLSFNTNQTIEFVANGFNVIGQVFNNLGGAISDYLVDVDRPFLMPDELIEKYEPIERAHKLLHELIPDDIIAQMKSEQGVWVKSKLRPNRKYQFKPNERIRVFDDEKYVDALCVIPNETYLGDDVIVAKLAPTSTDEERMLKIANHFTPDEYGVGQIDAVHPDINNVNQL